MARAMPSGPREGEDIPAGYKRTDVGVIPEDWDVDRIDQHTFITTGSKNTQDKREDGEYPFFVRSQDVERIGTYSYDGEAVLTAGDGVGTGKVFHYIRGRFDVHQRVYRIADFSDRLNGRYFYYQFSERFYHRIMSMTAKSSVDSVRMEVIAGMPIPLPPPPEQCAIAEALSNVDGLLGALDALIAKKQAVKQAAIQQLLTGKIRLQGFGGKSNNTRATVMRKREATTASAVPGGPREAEDVPAGYKHTEVGVIPEDWQTKRIGEMFEVRAGGDLDPTKSGDVQSEKHKHPIYANSLSRQGLYGFCAEADCRPGSITVTARGTLGRAFYRDTPFVAIGRLLVLDSKVNMDARYFCEFINHGVHFAVESTGVPQLTTPQVEGYFLPVPPFPEQGAIASVLSDTDAEIAALAQRRDKTRMIKQGMMQQLLTGQVRLVKTAAGSTLDEPRSTRRKRGLP